MDVSFCIYVLVLLFCVEITWWVIHSTVSGRRSSNIDFMAVLLAIFLFRLVDLQI